MKLQEIGYKTTVYFKIFEDELLISKDERIVLNTIKVIGRVNGHIDKKVDFQIEMMTNGIIKIVPWVHYEQYQITAEKVIPIMKLEIDPSKIITDSIENNKKILVFNG